MKRIRFVMIGGFLGAGKTTAIARLAKHHVEQGRRVAIVTNDQAYDLVDTHSLRAQGFDVGEVPGACFCCKFNDLVQTADTLTNETAPDVVIAEPVGSCTDLVATVVEPLRHLHGDEYEVAPMAVLLKPEHGRRILRDESGVGFSPKAAYIFLKQLEEADIVVVNKADKLTAEERDELIALVRERFPSKKVLAASGRTGEGFDALIEAIDARAPHHTRFMDVDYDIYAEGEAELGWLNCQATAKTIRGDRRSLDQLVLQMVASTTAALSAAGAEPAHLKVLGQIGADTAIANLVDSHTGPELSLAAEVAGDMVELIVNARVATAPEELEILVVNAIRAAAEATGWTTEVRGMQRFRPGRPTPTHRFSAS